MGFHAQQAIEKLLKALLITYGVEPEEQHSIARLVQQVARLDRAVADAIGSTTRLTPFAVHHRYPPRNPLTGTHGRSPRGLGGGAGGA